jgi:hypothetical protein
MSWIISGKSDPDFETYVAAVEAADSAALEVEVRQAYYNFIVGCKADGIWDAIKACCILAGARTLNGALVPLVSTMPAPTNVGLLDADYNRKNGITNGFNEYIDTNYSNSLPDQDNQHLAVYQPIAGSGSNVAGTGGGAVTGATHFYSDGNRITYRNRNSGNNDQITGQWPTGFLGMSRNNNANYSTRHLGVSNLFSRTSQTPATGNVWIFGRNPQLSFANTISFYSIGESLDLALLDARVTTLMSNLAAAIP